MSDVTEPRPIYTQTRHRSEATIAYRRTQEWVRSRTGGGWDADAIAIATGEADPAAYRVHVPGDIDVLRIRRNMGLTHEAFAVRFGLRLGCCGSGTR
jgi:hypothetical protein